MKQEPLEAFIETCKADISLQEKLKAATDVDAIVAIAKQAGFSFSADTLRLATLPFHIRKGNFLYDLSDKELSTARGGYGSWTEASNYYIGDQSQPRCWSA